MRWYLVDIVTTRQFTTNQRKEVNMRRTKRWWASLTKAERVWLVNAERADAHIGGGSSYLPEGYGACPLCSTPTLYGGLCPLCYKELNRIVNKANTAVATGGAICPPKR